MTYTPPEGVSIGPFTADTLPASFRAPAGAVASYKIYGTEAGAGIATSSGEPEGYKVRLTQAQSANIFDPSATDTEKGYIDGGYLIDGNNITTNSAWAVSEYIPIATGVEYLWMWRVRPSTVANPRMAFYDSSYTTISTIKYGDFSPTANRINFTPPAGAAYIRVSFEKSTSDEATLYPIAEYHVYIGADKLYATEYADFSTQKIYKLVEGELTPTDPPAPLPAITISADTTINTLDILGDVELSGEWPAIMGSTESESVDIGFTVDADEYIAFITIDDDPQIQVTDTITMPSSAGSFTLQVVSWGRELYTETVYNALS